MSNRVRAGLKELVVAAAALVAACGGSDSTSIGGSDAAGEASSGGDSSQGDGSSDASAADAARDDGASIDAVVEASGGDGPSIDGAAEAGSDGASSDGGIDAPSGDGPDAVATDGAPESAPPSDGASGCDGVTNGTYYVDPTNGSDGTASTGSDTAQGAAAAACAFKTLTRALKVVGSTPAAGTQIVMVGPATVGAGETFPFRIPANVIVKGQGAVTVQVPARMATPDGGSQPADGFYLDAPTSGLESLTLDGQGNGSLHGVYAHTGSAATTYVKNVTAKGFNGGAGIRIDGNGVLTIEEGTKVTNDIRGLRVTGSGHAVVANTNQANPIVFENNTQEGILVDATAWMTLAGTAGIGGAGSIIASGNASGLVVAQDQSGGLPTGSSVDGLVAWMNGTEGLRLEGGSVVTLRNSYVGANPIGVNIVSAAGSATWQDDTSHLDLGTSASTGAGKNTLQSIPAPDGGAGAQNTAVGLCYGILPNKSQTLFAYGNTWVNQAGTASIDCTQTAPGTLSRGGSCNGGRDLGGGGLNGNTIGISNCN